MAGIEHDRIIIGGLDIDGKLAEDIIRLAFKQAAS